MNYFHKVNPREKKLLYILYNNIYLMLSCSLRTVLSTSHSAFHRLLTTIGTRYYCYHHFTEEETGEISRRTRLAQVHSLYSSCLSPYVKWYHLDELTGLHVTTNRLQLGYFSRLKRTSVNPSFVYSHNN